MTRYNKHNIEDWDFREYVNPLNRDVSDMVDMDWEAEHFLSLNLFQVIVVDYLRITTLDALLSKGWATLSDDKTEVMLEPFGADVLPHMTSWRDRFTSQGRLRRRVHRSLLREWQKNSRLRFTILPDMKVQFPGLSGG